ncbi:MAG: DUF4290 domain-containing protein [Bacteroidales bacterium]|nr:DUF4290 domain-containing protein [Bacteroidales bacterium]MCF8338457.1 DUF4290 domain-containing protein [Bacteroidales bacterium]
MITENLEYNTTREKLVIGEYGRNIQKLISFAKTIENRDERTRFCHFIIQIMGQMHGYKEGGDVKRKMWDHMHIIANFELDVDAPYPLPSYEEFVAKPEPLTYSDSPLQYRQYGKNITQIIQKAIEFEEGEQKQALIKIIANHLKKLYLNWNRESVSDELIDKHLQNLSDGKLSIPEGVTLNTTSEILARTKRKKSSKQQSDSRHRSPKTDNRSKNYNDNRQKKSYYKQNRNQQQ